MMRYNKNVLLISFTVFLITSCEVGPDYVRPTVTTPVAFKEAKGNKDWKVAAPCDDKDRGEWWKIFHDPELNHLEDQLNHSNQTILNAAANYEEAKALVDEARANYFPTLVGTATLTREKQSSGSSSFVSSSTTGTATSTQTGTATSTSGSSPSNNISTTHSLVLDGTWEPDMWGSVRRSVEASQAGAESSAALLASTRLSQQASLAQYYFELRGIDTDQKILNDTVAGDQRSLALTRHQYKSGVAALADVVQAQSALEAAQAAAINNGITRAQYEHAIAVLIGVPPADFALLPSPSNIAPPAIPLEVPSALLERRPDIAQAERLMAQANAQIGVAIAAYFPTLTLNASATMNGQNYNRWFSMPNLGWSYGPQLAETILDGGLRKATVAASRATYQASVASYRQTVLTAFQDVEDNLASLRILKDEAVVQEKAVASARLALRLVINQYKSGTVPYSSVITAQLTAYTAEKNAADINYLRMTAAVGLIKALGGGWDRELPYRVGT
ncbi:MAG: efflux transporter outer membrane subunit [Gammaproteobacteria bacterium]|nr:MAG: efflux transporter outer membrane subunit [Gammaproteobacteria bacterium]